MNSVEVKINSLIDQARELEKQITDLFKERTDLLIEVGSLAKRSNHDSLSLFRENFDFIQSMALRNTSDNKMREDVL